MKTYERKLSGFMIFSKMLKKSMRRRGVIDLERRQFARLSCTGWTNLTSEEKLIFVVLAQKKRAKLRRLKRLQQQNRGCNRSGINSTVPDRKEPEPDNKSTSQFGQEEPPMVQPYYYLN